MELKKTVYETIEYAQTHEYSLTVGNIVMEGDELCYAEITDATIFNMCEVEAIRKFLDEVEKVMTPDAASIFVEDVDSGSVKIDIGYER